MRRHELSDEQFKKIEHMLPGRKGHVSVTAQDNRIFVNGWHYYQSTSTCRRR